MVASLGPQEPYTSVFESEVVELDGREVILDRTYFYPEGGGQPADRGTLGSIVVEDVQKNNGSVLHELAEAPSFSVGESITGEIDPAFRTYCMRAHTASHLLYGAGRRLLADLGYGGFGISEEKVRVDFATSTRIDDDTLVELERLVNRAVWDSRAVTWETYPREEALELEGIAFNTKTEEGLAGQTVRVVRVADWDIAACGGTHVENTREIGPVAVLERSNPGEGLTRIELAVGPVGIQQRVEEKRAALDAARSIGTSVENLPDAVARLQADMTELEAEIAELEDRLVSARITELEDEIIQQNGQRWLVGAVEGLDANALGDRAKSLVGDTAEVVALVGEDGRTVLAVAANETAADQIVDEVTNEFGGGGGGSAEFAQAGGIDSPPEALVDFLRDQ